AARVGGQAVDRLVEADVRFFPVEQADELFAKTIVAHGDIMTRRVPGEWRAHAAEPGLHAKLAEVMIGVQPSPAVPLAGRQPAEHRVRLEVLTASRRELVDQR